MLTWFHSRSSPSDKRSERDEAFVVISPSFVADTEGIS